MAKPRLIFSSARAADGYRQAVNNAADQLLKELYDEISSGMDTSEGKKDLQKMSENEEMIFRRKVIGCANAIMDSYGTGSEMDKTNPFYMSYRHSSLWNVSRRGTVDIVGRHKGFYIDIYGRKRYSTGKMEGVSLEKVYGPISSNGAIKEPLVPSYAFQRAEVWFTQGNKVNEVISRHITMWIKGMYQYFDYR